MLVTLMAQSLTVAASCHLFSCVAYWQSVVRCVRQCKHHFIMRVDIC